MSPLSFCDFKSLPIAMRKIAPGHMRGIINERRALPQTGQINYQKQLISMPITHSLVPENKVKKKPDDFD